MTNMNKTIILTQIQKLWKISEITGNINTPPNTTGETQGKILMKKNVKKTLVLKKKIEKEVEVSEKALITDLPYTFA